MPERETISFFGFRIGRFLFLLVSMVLMLTLRPFLLGFVGVKLLMEIFLCLILVSGAYAVSEKKSTFLIGLTLLVPTLAGIWANYVFELPVAAFVSLQALEALFLAYIAVVIVYSLFRGREITADTIFGAVCVYFLIGFFWALVFSILETLQPGSFQIPEGLDTTLSHFVYYSCVTLTTLGYGDITPITPPARSLALLEAIIGQLYLAIMIAGLVGIFISQSINNKSR
jgi:hypothetical protein